MPWKNLIYENIYASWNRSSAPHAGYSIVMPIPEDMPFLAHLAIEGLIHINRMNCVQYIVVGDGYGKHGSSGLARTLKENSKFKVDLCELPLLHRMIARRIACPHPVSIILGTSRASTDFVFLHDADAFFLNPDCIEKTFEYCELNAMNAIGVTARWDPFFQRIGYQIPGTWQMMFRTSWLRSHPPFRVFGRTMDTPHGTNTFDTMLYPQYLDYASGKIGVMPVVPKFVHFNGTIVTYRAWKRANGRQVVDELFRLVLLSILERVVPSDDGRRLLPSTEELAYGLTDSSRPIRYDTLDCARNFGEFRSQMQELCESPVFAGERAEKIQSMLVPFDVHFAKVGSEIGDQFPSPVKKFRRNGLA
jgi:hypothetical protein